MEQQQDHRLLSEMEMSLLGQSDNDVIVHGLLRTVRQELVEFANKDELTKVLLKTDSHMFALEGVIARGVIHRHGEPFAKYMQEHVTEPYGETVLEINNRVRTAVKGFLHEWSSTRHRFQPNPKPNPEQPYTFDQLMELEHSYPTVTFPPYERVREAGYHVMTPEDVQPHRGMPGPIQLSYDAAVIPESTLRKAVVGDVDGFKNDTEGGGFINPSSKIVRSLMTDLSSRKKMYQGRVIDSEDGIEAWLTSNMFPDDAGATRHYLRKGETGQMMYTKAPTTYESLAEKADVIIRFDTIRGDNRRDRAVKGPSGARLFHRFISEVYRKNIGLIEAKRKPKMMLYALKHMTIWSPHRQLPHLMNSPLPFGSNLASPKFFTDRGFVNFAYDNNPKGKHIVHYVDGEEIRIRPAWVHLIGELEEIHSLSSSIWRSIQWKHGDYSYEE